MRGTRQEGIAIQDEEYGREGYNELETNSRTSKDPDSFPLALSIKKYQKIITSF